jgi:hypothetical protein
MLYEPCHSCGKGTTYYQIPYIIIIIIRSTCQRVTRFYFWQFNYEWSSSQFFFCRSIGIFGIATYHRLYQSR